MEQISPEHHIPATSIAVLPFLNLSPHEENEYFSDGITEEIINALTKVRGLKVSARTSSFAFKGMRVDVRIIGQRLGVATILEGSVRSFRNRIRITAQLIRTDDGFHLWSKNFDREMADIFALQDEVSLLIADQIRENFGHIEIQDHLIDTPTRNVRAYNLYLKGRYHQLKWNAHDLKEAVRQYDASIQEDPTFTLPYFGAGLTYGLLASWGFLDHGQGFQRAHHYLSRGLALNRESELAHFAQATISLWVEWDFRKAVGEFKQAMEQNPAFTDAEEGLAELYIATGEFEQAQAHVQHMLRLNPLSANHHYTRGNIYFLSGDYEQALKNWETALTFSPDFALAIEGIAACYLLQGRPQVLHGFLLEHPLMQQPEVCRLLSQLMNGAPAQVPDAYLTFQAGGPFLAPWRVYLWVAMGRHDQALDWLEQAVEQRLGQCINFQHDPFFRPLHRQARFQQLVRKVFHPDRLPQKPASHPVATSVATAEPLLSEVEAANYLKQLLSFLEDQQPYLQPDLSLKALADHLHLHPNRLSWLINEKIQKNFNELINSYRLTAFQAKALDPANAHLTLLGLAYESGFNSKTAFNAYFKKATGTTPSAWLKTARSAS